MERKEEIQESLSPTMEEKIVVNRGRKFVIEEVRFASEKVATKHTTMVLGTVNIILLLYIWVKELC